MDPKRYFPNTHFSLTLTNQPGQFANLKPAWDELASQQGNFMPFLCFDWYSLWLDHFLNNNELYVITLYNGSDAVAIAPLLKKKETFKGLNVRKVELIGNAYSPFRYLLCKDTLPDKKALYLNNILQFFIHHHNSWDIIDLTPIPEENSCFQVVKKAIQNVFPAHSEYVAYGDWYLDNINFSGEDYLASLPKKVRKDVSYCKRRLEKTGDLAFKVIQDDDDLDHHMDLYYQVYSKSWQQKESLGPTFHRDLAKVFCRNGWLRLGFLLFNGNAIASQFWVSCMRYSYILKTVYDQEYRKFSPGKILTAEMMKHVIDTDDVDTVDYGQGDEPYKKDWTPQRRERKGLYVFNSNLKGKYLYWITNYIQPIINRSKYLKKIKKY